MGIFAAAVRIVAQRSLGNWRLLLTVAIGTVLAAALASTVAIYYDAVRDLGLAHALKQPPPRDLDILITSSNVSVRRREYEQRRELTARFLGQGTGGVVADTVRQGQSATFFPTAPGEPTTEDPNRARAYFQFGERLDAHTRVVEGRRPAQGRPAPGGAMPEVEVVVGKATAERHNLGVGQTYDLHPYWRQQPAPVRVRIVGLIEQTDPEERYWAGRSDRFTVATTTWPTWPLFTDEATFVDVIGGYLQDMDATLLTVGFSDKERINSRNAEEIERSIRNLDLAVRQDIERSRLDTKLTDTIAGYRQRLFFTRLPLLALMLQIIGIVLYYLVMIGTMLVERQSGEIALLKSRGAGTAQVVGAYAIEGGALALLGAALGPPLAAAAIAVLGPTPPFRDLSGGGLLEVHLSPMAFLLAGGGALLALAALLLPAYRAARASIVLYKQRIGRPPQQSLFIKYYLDVFLIVVGAILFYELRQRGSFVTERLSGDLHADPLLLVTPSLFMLMIALLFLRLFPLVLRLASWATSTMNGVALPLGLRRVVRAPVHYSRLILLLILVSAVGVFAAGFRPTLQRSYEDRVRYEAGAALRVADIRSPSGLSPNQLAAEVAAGARLREESVTPVWRTRGSYNLTQFRSLETTVLGVRPEGFSRVAYWREDFADGPLAQTLRPLQDTDPHPLPSVTVPEGATFLGIWIWNPLPFGALTYGLRLVDGNGLSWDFRLDGPPRDAYREGEWQFYIADLSRPNGRPLPRGAAGPQGRLQLEAVNLRVNQQPLTPDRPSIFFDDLQASRSGPGQEWWLAGFADRLPVERFETLDGYEVMTGMVPQPEPNAFNRSEQRRREGEASAQLTFERRRGGQGLFGFRTRGDGAPLPVLASASFLRAGNLKVGDTFPLYINSEYVQARIAGQFSYFPTFVPKPDGPHLLVADLDRMLRQASRVSGRSEGGRPNEAWAAQAPAQPLPRKPQTLGRVEAQEVADLNTLRADQRRDPLVAASWEGILFLSFVAVLLLTALGFTVYSYLSAQTRTLEFAILRTMGLSGEQIFALVGFEHLFVILTGMLAGTILGLPLGRAMLGYVGITETGAEVVPPFVSQISWTTIAIADGLLAAMFLTAIGALVLLYGRLAVHRALRMGEL